MSTVTEENDDLCADATTRDAAIKLFNDTFGFGAEDTLSFFFSAGDVLRLLNEPEGIGIKVFPALHDQPGINKLQLTMVLKPFKFPADEVAKEKKINLLGDPAVCCPTPGHPIDGGRTAKIKHWIQKLVDLL